MSLNPLDILSNLNLTSGDMLNYLGLGDPTACLTAITTYFDELKNGTNPMTFLNIFINSGKGMN